MFNVCKENLFLISSISIGIGDDAGLTSVKAHFDRDHPIHSDWTD
jgi:hypothetical protein